MRKDKQLAEELRRAGKSYKEIRRTLNIPIATLSNWFRGLDWSMEIKRRLADRASFSSLSRERIQLLVAANKKRWEAWHQEARDQAVREFSTLKTDPLFLGGLMLYWGEGDKTMQNGRVRLANSDPEMLKIFNLFLQRVGVRETKIKVWLLLYPDLIDTVQKNFWSRAIGISHQQFNKSIFIKGRHPTRRLSYGVGNIEVYSRELKEKIMKWITLYKNDFLYSIENQSKLSIMGK